MKMRTLLSIILAVFFLAGCFIDSTENDYVITYMTGLTNADFLNNEYPEYYTILVEENIIHIDYLSGPGGQPESQDFDLDSFEIDEEGLSFSYDTEEVSLERLSDSVYEDEDGVRFQVEVLEEVDQ